MRAWKSWALAFAVATGAFWLIMLQDPPKSVASDPAASFSPMQMTIPLDLPMAAGGNTF